MAVEVNIDDESLLKLFFEIFGILNKVKCFRKGILPILVESSVQILSKETSSIVTRNNSVRVKHRNNKKMIPF